MMVLSEDERQRFQEYCKRNSSIFSNRVVQSFFKKEEHVILLLRTLDGNHHSKKVLDDKFRKFYFHIRFVKFLVSTIKYCTIDQLRNCRKNEMRQQLIFDRPASDEGETTIGEILLNKKASYYSESTTSDPTHFQSTFTNERLTYAFTMLSHKQQLITTLCYASCYQDNEIAKILNVSPQAVCKTRNLALQKLRVAMTGGGDSYGYYTKSHIYNYSR